MNSNAGRGFLKAIIIVGIIFIGVYYISYNKWLDHDFDSVDITYRVEDEEENTTSNDVVNDKEYQLLYSNINYELLQYNFGEEFYDVYYGNKPFYDEYYIFVGITNLIKNDIIVNCNFEKEFTSQEVKNEINKLFGNVNYDNKSFTTKNNKITINYSDNKYSVKLNSSCSGYDYSSGGIKNIYSKTEMKNDNLYIYEKALYVDNVKDSNGNIVFNYHKDINKNSEIIANVFEKVDSSTLPTYVYKFIKENNQYVIKSITKVL